MCSLAYVINADITNAYMERNRIISSLPSKKSALSGLFMASSSMSVSLLALYTEKVMRKTAKQMPWLTGISSRIYPPSVWKNPVSAINKELTVRKLKSLSNPCNSILQNASIEMNCILSCK